MGKLSRTSGHQFERQMANELQSIGWLKAKRHQENQIQEALGYDLDHTYPFYIQCKNCMEYKLSGIKELPIEQGRYRLLLTNKKGHHPILAVMYTEEFDELFDKYIMELEILPLIDSIQLKTNRWRNYIRQYNRIILPDQGLSIMKWTDLKGILHRLKTNNIL